MHDDPNTRSGDKMPTGAIAAMFIAQRTALDPEGYDLAAKEMEALAAHQPGYLGIDSVRNASGLGITISYWASEEAAKAWRDNPDHVAVREKGRKLWYDWYELHAAEVTRSYAWRRPSISA